MTADQHAAERKPRRGHRHCRFCGGLTETRNEAGTHLRCTDCGRELYVNSKPCAETVIIREDGRVLLLRRTIEPFYGYWDIPGGFLEEDELPEEGARREAREEAELEVELRGLIGMTLDSYPGEERLTVLTISYLAEPRGEPRAGDETGEVGFFAEDEIPEKLAFGHARETIRKAFALRQKLMRQAPPDSR